MARSRPVDPRLLRAVPQARRSVVGLGVAGVLQGVATVCAAFAVGALVTAVVHGDDLVGPITFLALAFGARAALAYAVERTAATAGVAVSGALRVRLLGTWLERPAETWLDPAVGTTLAAQGCTAVETYVTRYLPALVHASVVPVLAVGALFVVDWPSAVIVVLTLPLLPLFAALIGRTTQEATERRWAALQGLSGHFVDVVRGLPTLVAYGRGTRQVATVRSVSERHREETMATLRLSFLSSAALELLATLSVALVAVTVGLRLAAGDLDLLPGLVAILLAPEAYWPIRRVGAEFHAAADGAQALDRIMDELDADAAVPTRIPGSGVVLHQVGYRYPGDDSEVLRDLTLTAGGGLTVVTGASGSGKTTLLELVAGLRTPTAGTVDAAPAHLVTQRPFLMPGSVRENLQLVAAGPMAPDRLWEALRRVGLDGAVAGMPRGLDTRLGDDGFGLSAGQRARLAVARAVLSDRPVVLLDEPTAHLDSEGVQTIHAVITALAADRTVIATTHRPELVAVADRHVVLEDLRAAR
ncbi:MAG TPA: thiol reductant ABC exporter subunit CydD [Lapillicoccus sp.]|jgi:thiol reductant ABC exporter CydD subunit|uniref:thiol reductant ABC exporter subunit CydD n=1 Tax=Lapillicoccus sp. TaxID=1909287 RepID=UPI002F9226C6